METVCDPSSSFSFFFWMVYWRDVSLYGKKKKIKYSSALPDVCITFPHGGGKNRQARDLCDSTRSLRHYCQCLCSLLLGFFFQSAGKSQFQHLCRDIVFKAWQTPPIELQCDCTLTSSYQASISYLPLSQQVPSLFLPRHKQMKIQPVSKKNSPNLLPTTRVGFMQLRDRPSPCGGPFCAPGGPEWVQSFCRQTFCWFQAED